jgi:hypothetical protein
VGVPSRAFWQSGNSQRSEAPGISLFPLRRTDDVRVSALNGNSGQAVKVHERTPASVPPEQSRHFHLMAFKPLILTRFHTT